MSSSELDLKKCICCGSENLFQRTILWPALVDEWSLNAVEVQYIDRQQGLTCETCGSNFRAMALAHAVMGEFNSEYDVFDDFLEHGSLQTCYILEVNKAQNLTRFLEKVPNHFLAEYPDVDILKLPYPDDLFDLVLHSDTLEHITDPISALKECYRVLKPGGVCAFTVPMVVDRLTISRAGMPRSFHGGPKTRDDDYIVHYEFGADAWKYVIKSGFEVCKIRSLEYPTAQVLIGVKAFPGKPGTAAGARKPFESSSLYTQEQNQFWVDNYNEAKVKLNRQKLQILALNRRNQELSAALEIAKQSIGYRMQLRLMAISGSVIPGKIMQAGKLLGIRLRYAQQMGRAGLFFSKFGFDRDWYLSQYPDVAAYRGDLLNHYLLHGWKENRSPNKYFNEAWYIRSYPELAEKTKDNLYFHYLTTGWKENRDPSMHFSTRGYLQQFGENFRPIENPIVDFMHRGKDESLVHTPEMSHEDRALAEKIRFFSSHEIQDYATTPAVARTRSAVFCHLFYNESAGKILEQISHIKGNFDLYISTQEKHLDQIREQVHIVFPENSAEIVAVPNAGYDIAPFLIEFGRVIQDYDLVCKIHEKKSEHYNLGNEWRDHLLGNLLGSPEVIETIIANFLTDPGLGMVYPIPIASLLPAFISGMAYKKYNPDVGRICTGLGLEYMVPHAKLFPAGSMFWARPAVFTGLIEAGLTYDDFGTYAGERYGTLAHALERYFPFGVERAGYHVKRIFLEKKIWYEVFSRIYGVEYASMMASAGFEESGKTEVSV